MSSAEAAAGGWFLNDRYGVTYVARGINIECHHSDVTQLHDEARRELHTELLRRVRERLAGDPEYCDACFFRRKEERAERDLAELRRQIEAVKLDRETLFYRREVTGVTMLEELRGIDDRQQVLEARIQAIADQIAAARQLEEDCGRAVQRCVANAVEVAADELAAEFRDRRAACRRQFLPVVAPLADALFRLISSEAQVQNAKLHERVADAVLAERPAPPAAAKKKKEMSHV